ncbi:hypothetical protein SDC9_198567 [bioreactor metagenome]|uniref:Uncharacterized protein n=1 Tax=bioreactor metagenome TaxID=1076179 RepID=A0A645II09_9ZZZZ
MQAKVGRLLGCLLYALGIPQRTKGYRTTHGHRIWLMAIRPQFFADAFHFSIYILIGIRIHKSYIRSQKVIEQLVALLLPNAPLFQHKDAGKAELVAAGSGQHGVVALGTAGG